MAKVVADYTYTDSELLALWREADAFLASGGQEVEVLGKRYRRSSAAEISAKIRIYEQRVNAAAGRNRHVYARYRSQP